MNADDISFFHKWFNHYVKGFYSKDQKIQENIRLKEKHTLRVCENILLIGSALNLDSNELYLARTIALFHDLGRFEQFKKHHTFNDSQSVDHALLGVQILKRENALYHLAKEEQSLIFKAIRYHNVRKLPTNEDNKCLFYAKLIRDADKLDIWYVVTKYYEKCKLDNPILDFGLPDTSEYSRHLIESILNCKIINIEKLKTLNDLKLMQISWVFDINFLPTFVLIKNRKYLDKIIKTLPETDKIQKIKRRIEDYLNEKVKLAYEKGIIIPQEGWG